MKLPITFVLCCTIILVSGAEVGVSNQTPSLNKNVEFPPEPAPTTDSPVTTDPPKPPKPSPPTQAPPTTTPKPDTTTSLPTSTTTAPVPPSPNPTPNPTPLPPAPKPQTSQWIVNGTNQTCIILQMAAQFNISYLTTDNKTMSRLLTLPTSNLTTVDGTCGDAEQVIKISWNSTVAPMTNNDTLVIHFMKNGTKYALHHMELYLVNLELPKIKSNSTVMLIRNATEYQIPLSNSYRCLKLQQISLASNTSNTTGTFDVSDLRFQAFRVDKTTGFGLAEDCPFETADYVPIAVGVGLIILVVVVLIAYIVGRRISLSSGYISM